MPAMSVLRRPRLLLSAAVTITVPGVLALLALLGHDHAASQAGRASAGTAGPVALPAVLAGGPAGFRDVVAQMAKVSGMSGQGSASAALSAQENLGMHMLVMAAAADLNTSYAGVELIAQTGVDGTDTMISNVWHQGGGLTVTQTSDATVLTASQPNVVYDIDSQAPEGVFGVTKALVALLGKHYVAVYRGTGSVLGRPALIVELHRADGSLAARFWLDAKTMVPLRRDVFDESAQLISHDVFVEVQFGSLPAPPGATSPVSSPWAEAAVPAKLVMQLDSRGWQLPDALPGGLSLYTAAECQTGAGEVVDLGYSDGLSVVSLFVQRGTLAKMTGWQPVDLGGRTVYVAEHSITWAGRGLVYTVIADAPPQTVEQVVAALPQNSGPGLLLRLRRGLGRLAALVDPFH